MFRNLLYLITALSIIISLTACMDDKEKQELRDYQSSILASQRAASAAASSASAIGESSQESNSASTEEKNSGSTIIDNKPPSQNQKDGITIYIPKSDIDKFNSELSEIGNLYRKPLRIFQMLLLKYQHLKAVTI